MDRVQQPTVTYLPPEAGETIWVLGDQVTFKADGERDDLTLFVSIIPSGGGPPPHVHYQQTEAHVVLEGTFSFLSGDAWFEAETGSCVIIPRGVLHTFRNNGSMPARLVSTNSMPDSHERWFRHVGVPIADRVTFTPPTEAPDMADVLASAAREDIHMMAPDAPPSGSSGH